MNDQSTAYLLARLILAATMLGHGLVRLPKLQAFSNWMTETFSASFMPALIVRPFSIALPLAEFIIGLLLIAGLFTRAALLTGSILMIFLIIGSCLIEKWEWVSIQMFYALFYVLLFVYLKYNHYALDQYFNKK